jgi:hypothetical protein
MLTGTLFKLKDQAVAVHHEDTTWCIVQFIAHHSPPGISTPGTHWIGQVGRKAAVDNFRSDKSLTPTWSQTTIP